MTTDTATLIGILVFILWYMRELYKNIMNYLEIKANEIKDFIKENSKK